MHNANSSSDDQLHGHCRHIRDYGIFDENIFLIGFMGTGKTTVSEYLKTLLGMDVVEMDEAIARQEGLGIPDIFAIRGEDYFRNAETCLLKQMQNRKGFVVSCGGGVPMRDENVREMKKSGRIILLTAAPETIFERVRDSHDRPLLENNKTPEYIETLMEKRRPKYEAAADLIIHTDHKSIPDICDEIIDGILSMNSGSDLHR
ncbi:MAG: shikimate kinase [Eubacteriales bacterium]|nr:shikimate kinase [Eubacteriales bacterium]